MGESELTHPRVLVKKEGAVWRWVYQEPGTGGSDPLELRSAIPFTEKAEALQAASTAFPHVVVIDAAAGDLPSEGKGRRSRRRHGRRLRPWLWLGAGILIGLTLRRGATGVQPGTFTREEDLPFWRRPPALEGPWFTSRWARPFDRMGTR